MSRSAGVGGDSACWARQHGFGSEKQRYEPADYHADKQHWPFRRF